jgi:eukaryotic-like serine/threonine-protein kinase
MSPEQVRGERAGPESDLYSLGVVLYEMLTGEPPYTADNPLATAMKHLEEPPRRPRQANPAVPEELDALTAKLLAKDPADRYASAAALAEDLRRARDGLPPLAAGLGQQTTAQMSRDTGETRVAPAVPGSATGGRSRRRALLPLAALLLGVILLGGLAWALSSGLLSGGPSGAGGAQQVEVPDLRDLSLEEARGRLDEAGLRLGSQERAVSGETPAGAVIDQVPTAGTEADRGSAVDVIVSSGPAPELTTQSSSATSSASSSASSTATSNSTATATGDGGAAQNPEETQERAEEAAEERQKALEEARKEAEKRQQEREKARKEAQEGRED